MNTKQRIRRSLQRVLLGAGFLLIATGFAGVFCFLTVQKDQTLERILPASEIWFSSLPDCALNLPEMLLSLTLPERAGVGQSSEIAVLLRSIGEQDAVWNCATKPLGTLTLDGRVEIPDSALSTAAELSQLYTGAQNKVFHWKLRSHSQVATLNGKIWLYLSLRDSREPQTVPLIVDRWTLTTQDFSFQTISFWGIEMIQFLEISLLLLVSGSFIMIFLFAKNRLPFRERGNKKMSSL